MTGETFFFFHQLQSGSVAFKAVIATEAEEEKRRCDSAAVCNPPDKAGKAPGARRDEFSRWRNKARPEDKDGRVRKNEFSPFHKVLLLGFFFLLAILAPQPAFWRGSGSDVKKKKPHKHDGAECDGCSITTTYPRLSDSLPFFRRLQTYFLHNSPLPPPLLFLFSLQHGGVLMPPPPHTDTVQQWHTDVVFLPPV